MNCLKTVLYSTTGACVVSVGLVCAQKAASPATPATYAASTEWPTYGHDPGGMRFSPLKQITPANVGTLQIAWVYHLRPEGYAAPARGARGGAAEGENAAADASGAPARGRNAAPAPGRGGSPTGFMLSEGTPLVVDGIMYLSSPYGRVVALNATTGKEVWTYQVPGANPSTRGVEYFSGDAQTPPQIVVGTSNSKLFTLDAETGVLNTKFGDNGVVTLDKPPTSTSIVYKNLIIICGRVGEGSGPGTAGDVKAYDIPRRKAGMDVSLDPAARRAQLRHHLVRRQRQPAWRGECVGLHDRRRSARHRLYAVRRAFERSVRRRPARQQPLQHESCCR
jgi:quinoprotein glucose dehydrogenase